MKIRLSTKIFAGAIAAFIIITIVTLFINMDNNGKTRSEFLKTDEALDNGKIIHVEYTKTTEVNENNE